MSVVNPLLLDYEQASSHIIRVRVTDEGGRSYEENVAVAVGDVASEKLTGSAGNDTLWGGAGKDSFKGAGGNDLLRGGGGKDALDGGAGSDTADFSDKTKKVEVTLKGASDATAKVGGKAEDTIKNFESATGGSGGDKLNGDGKANVLTGNAGKDTLDGAGGNDTLLGGIGKDRLEGGKGKDVFLFNTAPGAASVDTIADFKPKDDTIQLDHAIFTALGVGPLAKLDFAANKAGQAKDASDHIIYETDTGKLFYDADGAGGAARIQFAVLTGKPHVTYADFVIV